MGQKQLKTCQLLTENWRSFFVNSPLHLVSEAQKAPSKLPVTELVDSKKAVWLAFSLGGIEFDLPVYVAECRNGYRLKYFGKPKRYKHQAQLLADFITLSNQSRYVRSDSGDSKKAIKVKQQGSEQFSTVTDQSITFNSDSFVILLTVREL